MDWLIVFIGIVIGAVVTAYVFRRNFVGTLRVDQSDPTDGTTKTQSGNIDRYWNRGDGHYNYSGCPSNSESAAAYSRG